MRIKMTQEERERTGEAAQATFELTDEERKAEVEQVAEKMAREVDVEKVSKPKAKKASARKTNASPNNPSSTRVKSPAQESASPSRQANNPLQGVTVDPEANYPKLLHLSVSVGKDDTRTMDEFIAEVKDALTTEANVSVATVLLNKVAIDGKHILGHHYQAELERLRPTEEAPSE